MLGSVEPFNTTEVTVSKKSDPIPSLLERAHPRDPSRRLYFVSYVTPDGRRRQRVMGDAGTPRAERNYREFLKAYLAGSPPADESRCPAGDAIPELSIESLAARFLRWADDYYRKNGQPTKEAHNHVRALAPLTPGRPSDFSWLIRLCLGRAIPVYRVFNGDFGVQIRTCGWR